MDDRATMSLKWIQDLSERLFQECNRLAEMVETTNKDLVRLGELAAVIHVRAQELDGELTTKPEPVEETPAPEPEEEKFEEIDSAQALQLLRDIPPAAPSSKKRRRRSASEKKTRGAAPHG